MFQSLVGFKINWNFTEEFFRLMASMFQSLVGFKINWNDKLSLAVRLCVVFQSLIGFKINWNSVSPWGGLLGVVSIPNRV